MFLRTQLWKAVALIYNLSAGEAEADTWGLLAQPNWWQGGLLPRNDSWGYLLASLCMYTYINLHTHLSIGTYMHTHKVCILRVCLLGCVLWLPGVLYGTVEKDTALFSPFFLFTVVETELPQSISLLTVTWFPSSVTVLLTFPQSCFLPARSFTAGSDIS